MASDAIPAFPGFRELKIEDKLHFDQLYKTSDPPSSEYSFVNFFCWRSCDHSKATMLNGNLCVLAGEAGGGEYFFQPVGNGKIEETVLTCAQYLKDKGGKPRLSRLTEKFVEMFKGNGQFAVTPDRDNFEYLYYAKDLAELKGKKFDGKRNRIRKFKDLMEGKYLYGGITAKDIPACLELLERWKAEKKGLCIDEPIRETLKNFDALKVKGSAVTIDGVIQAFTIGEKLNDETAVIYIEVADPRFTGLSQYINQKFCGEWPEMKYINREQDLGDAGLRRAKLSYHPCELTAKYEMTVKY